MIGLNKPFEVLVHNTVDIENTKKSVAEAAASFKLGHPIERFRSMPRVTVKPMVRTDWNMIDPVTVRPPCGMVVRSFKSFVERVIRCVFSLLWRDIFLIRMQ